MNITDEMRRGFLEIVFFDRAETRLRSGGVFSERCPGLRGPPARARRAMPRRFAHANGLAPGVKATAITDWLKQDFALGHGHAMSIVAYIKGKRS